ncbi:MAG: AI-2E family transporter [Phycisphaeraceae bacterium]
MNDRTTARSLWREPLVATLVVLLALAALIALTVGPIGWIYDRLEPVLVPVAIALALAYILNPLVSWVDKRSSVPRVVTVSGMLAAVSVLVLTAFLYMIPLVLRQLSDLIGALPGYAERGANWTAERLGTDVASLQQRLVEATRETIDSFRDGEPGTATAGIDIGAVASAVFQSAGVGFEVIGSTIGLLTYLAIALGVCLFSLFVFLWRFDEVVARVPPLVPASSRPRFLELVGKMDLAVSAVIRGRVVQSLIYGCVLSAGWAIVGVPYWLLLGVAGGVLNLVPFLGAAVWPLAVILALADSGADAGILGPLLWPTLVYLIAQGLDGWVVEPWVQGSATNLGPLTIMLVVLIGASLAGIVGMLLAIPVAACARVLLVEEIVPRLRDWAESS